MAAWSFARKAAVATVVASVLLLASSSLVAASPLAGHDRTSGDASSQGAQWGHKHPTYPVTFDETGLPSGTNWSVQLVGPGGPSSSTLNSSNTTAIGFERPNGTYSFEVGPASNGSAEYDASPASGSITVAGAAVEESIVFTAVPLTDLTFVETGLPAGTFWSVALNGNASGFGGPGYSPVSPLCFGLSYWNGSVTSTVAFAVPAGNYTFSIGNVTNASVEYVPTPANGSVTADGAPVTVEVDFASVPLYNLTFDETGLPGGAPNGTYWFVTLSNDSVGYLFNSSANSSISFEVPSGVYNFTVGNVSVGAELFVATPGSGVVTVDGSAVTVSIAFVPVALYNLTFDEAGLPSGAFWTVQIWNESSGGFYNGSSGTSVGFLVPNGTYSFYVSTENGYPFAPPLCGNGSGTGLGAGYVATPQTGNVTVDGSSVVVDVTFAPIQYTTVTFVETGLPNGTFWTVDLSGGPYGGYPGYGYGSGPLCAGTSYFSGSTASSIAVTVPTGTYAYEIGNVSANGALYVPAPAAGNVTVDGSPVVVDVTFTPVALFALEFVETGLPAGSLWSVALSGGPTGWTFNVSSASTIGFSLPNGTYNFTVLAWYPAGFAPLWSNGTGGSSGGRYVATPSSGTVTIDGASVTVSIGFARLTLYTVTFEETGLPNGTFWWVAIGSDSGRGWPAAAQPSCGGPGPGGPGGSFTTVAYRLANGTYNFTVGNATHNGTVYVPSPATGTVTVSGANVTVVISFADPPAGGHGASPSAHSSAAPAALGTTVLIGAGAAILALLAGALLLARRRTPPRTP